MTFGFDRFLLLLLRSICLRFGSVFRSILRERAHSDHLSLLFVIFGHYSAIYVTFGLAQLKFRRSRAAICAESEDREGIS